MLTPSLKLKNSNSLINLNKVIRFSLDNHNEEIEKYLFLFDNLMNPTRKWFEFIYCILAGTQVRTSTAKKVYEILFEKIGYDLILLKISKSRRIADKIQMILKSNGYRFFASKTETILNTARFFKDYNYNPDKFINIYHNYKDIRNELITIKGIGFKIASHWLRNIGVEIPIIDNHVKNLLYYTGIIKNKKKSYIEFENLIIELARILNIKIFLLDLSIWIFGRENCANNKCLNCFLKDLCLKINF